MATSPFLKFKKLNTCKKMIRKQKTDFVFSAVKISNKTLRSFTIDNRGILKMIDSKYYNIDSQNLKKPTLMLVNFILEKNHHG